MDHGEAGNAFIGRHKELAALRSAYADPRSAFWPVYGRRRVGKSELILHFSRHHPTLYLVGKKGAPAEQLQREFLELASILLDEPLLATAPLEGWKKIFESVVSRWRKAEKLILVLDEFQWLAEKSPELASVLQELWDRSWRKSGRMFLILCGSYIGFMEREVLGEKSPLYGRRTGQILLRPFGFREAGAFHPNLSPTQKAMTYFICGGVPLYLNFFDPHRSISQNIEQALLSEVAPLYREPDFLLREELREVENYYMILMALAGSTLPRREVARGSGVGDHAVSYYLDQLAGLGYVDKHFPLTADKPKVRDVRYRLVDPLLRFWFHFIYPHTSRIAQAGPARALAQLVEPKLDAYFGRCFEDLCREALPGLYAKEGVNTDFKVGSYWNKNVQIDVVGLRSDGWIDLGECKWGTVSVSAVTDELESKVRHYHNPNNATIGRRVFLRSLKASARTPPPAVRVHTLQDLYAGPA